MHAYIIPCVAGTLIYSALFGPPLNHSCLFYRFSFSCFWSFYRFISFICFVFLSFSFFHVCAFFFQKCVFIFCQLVCFFRSSFEFVHFLCMYVEYCFFLFSVFSCLFFLNLDTKLSTICLPFICCLSVHISVGLFVF